MVYLVTDPVASFQIYATFNFRDAFLHKILLELHP